jgi:hypothetical protein
MAWETTDIKRSIQRYLEGTLDEDWTIRTQRRQVSDEDRPVAVIQTGEESVLRAREARTQGEIESLVPVTITCYPAVPTAPDKEDPDAPFDAIREADLAAARLVTQLRRLVAVGLTVTSEPEEDVIRQWAGPFRIPLYDYADVPLTGKDRGGPADPHDVLWVQRESLQVRPIQDPEDDSRYTVICEFRVTVEEPGRVVPDEEGYVADHIEGAFFPPPGSE